MGLCLCVATAAWAAVLPTGIELPSAEGMAPLGDAADVVALDAAGQVLASSGEQWVKLPDLGAWLAARPVAKVSRLVVDRRTAFRPVRVAIGAMVNSGRKWLQFAGGERDGLEIMQDVSTDYDPAALRLPAALTVHLASDRIWVGRAAEAGVSLRAPASTRAALDTLRALVDLDRRLNPAGRLAIINTDDDVPFGDTFATIGVVQSRGLDQVALAGGPRAGDAAGAIIPAPPPGPAARPRKVGVLPTGRIIIDGTRVVDATSDVRFWEDCAGHSCTVMLEQPRGQVTVLGTRALDGEDRTRRWIFGHEVHAATGLAGTGPAVELNGVFTALPRVEGSEPTPPPVGSGEPRGVTLLGALSKDVIDAAIRKTAVALASACYEDLLGRSSEAAGKLSIRLVIGPEGKVTRSDLATVEVGDAEFHQCMLDAISAVAFPPPRGGGIVIVTYPFVFAPG